MKHVLVVCLMLSTLSACTDEFAKPDSNRPYITDTHPTNGDRSFEGEDPLANIRVSATVLLSGPYMDGGTMHTALNEAGLLPKEQPYAAAPYWYDGEEALDRIPREIVDWMLVGLLDPATLEPVSRRAALLTTNGDIVDLDGISPVAFKARPDHYLIAIYHRNHLDIMSDVLLDVTSGTGVIDFTSGNRGSQEVAPGLFAMIQGDVNGDQLVKYNGSRNDKNAVLKVVGTTSPNTVLPIYHAADVNMDGFVRFNGLQNDKQAILEAVGILTPNHIVVGQLY